MKKDHISSLPEDRDLSYRFVSPRCVAPLLGCQRFCGCSSNCSKGPIFWTSPQSLLSSHRLLRFRGFTEHPSTQVCTHRHAHTFLSLKQQGAHLFSPPTPQPLIAPLARSPPSDSGTRPQISTHQITFFQLRPRQTRRPRHLSSPSFPFSVCLTLLSYPTPTFHLFPSPVSISACSLPSHPRPSKEHVRYIRVFWVGVQIELQPQEGHVLINLNHRWQMTCAECAGDTGTGCAGENRNVYTLTRADGVPWHLPSAGIISLRQNTCGNWAGLLLRMTFSQSEWRRRSTLGR